MDPILKTTDTCFVFPVSRLNKSSVNKRLPVNKLMRHKMTRSKLNQLIKYHHVTMPYMQRRSFIRVSILITSGGITGVMYTSHLLLLNTKVNYL